MLIKDLVSLAKYSELSGVAAKDDIDAIVAFINLGMIELYKRFPIKVEEYIVNLVDGVAYYDMPSNFMYYLSVHGEITISEKEKNKNNELPVNDEDNPYSVFFNDWNTIQIPSSVVGSYVSIIYVAKPAMITSIHAEDGVTELELPDSLIEALLSYVGYRAHLGIRGDAQSENNAHWRRFVRSVDKAIELGIATPIDSVAMPFRLSSRGFV